MRSVIDRLFEGLSSDSDSDNDDEETSSNNVKNADDDDDDCVQIIEPPPKKERRTERKRKRRRETNQNAEGDNNEENEEEEDDDEDEEEEDEGPIEVSELKPQEDKYEYSKLPRVKLPKGLEGESCPICLESPMNNPVGSKKCSHSFCYDCIYNWLSRYNKLCPTCRQKINKSDLVAYTDEKPEVIELD